MAAKPSQFWRPFCWNFPGVLLAVEFWRQFVANFVGNFPGLLLAVVWRILCGFAAQFLPLSLLELPRPPSSRRLANFTDFAAKFFANLVGNVPRPPSSRNLTNFADFVTQIPSVALVLGALSICSKFARFESSLSLNTVSFTTVSFSTAYSIQQCGTEASVALERAFLTFLTCKCSTSRRQCVHQFNAKRYYKARI